MGELIQTKKILLTSLLAGVLQFIYNLIVLIIQKTPFNIVSILPTLFEGTFFFILFGFIFIYLNKDIFKHWIFFSITSSLIHSLLLVLLLKLSFFYLISSFTSILFIIITSIKLTEYIMKDKEILQ